MSERPVIPETGAPAPGHNKPAADALLADVRHALHAHSRHTARAIEELHKFFVAVMRTCEYAHQNEDTRKEVELALYTAGISPPKGREWFRAIICTGYTHEEREAQKTNISKWASALCYAERQGVTADGLAEWLKEKSIAQVARHEAQERRKEKQEKGDGAELPKQRRSSSQPIPMPCEVPADVADQIIGWKVERAADGSLQFVPPRKGKGEVIPAPEPAAG